MKVYLESPKDQWMDVATFITHITTKITVEVFSQTKLFKIDICLLVHSQCNTNLHS